MTVSVGLIGAGVMGADHARTLASQVGGVTLRSLTDADSERAETIAAETNAETIAPDPMTLINDPTVDAVLIASPDETHRELTLACLAARKPVLCEKPLAPTASECLEVIAAEEELGRRLVQVGYMRRFDPGYVEMKARLLSGTFGLPLFFHSIHRNLSAPPWFDSRMALSNSAVHDIDISRWLLGEELATIQVFQPTISTADSIVSPIFLVIETEGGKIISVENNNNGGYGYDVQGELACEKGSISISPPVDTTVNLRLAKRSDYAEDWRQRFKTAYAKQLQAWVNAIEADTADGASAWDGYAASQVAEAGLEALAENRAAKIELAPKPPLYEP